MFARDVFHRERQPDLLCRRPGLVRVKEGGRKGQAGNLYPLFLNQPDGQNAVEPAGKKGKRLDAHGIPLS